MLIIMGVTKGGQGVSWPPWTLIPLYVLVLFSPINDVPARG